MAVDLRDTDITNLDEVRETYRAFYSLVDSNPDAALIQLKRNSSLKGVGRVKKAYVLMKAIGFRLNDYTNKQTALGDIAIALCEGMVSDRVSVSVELLPVVLSLISSSIAERLNVTPKQWSGRSGLSALMYLGASLMCLWLMFTNSAPHQRIFRYFSVKPHEWVQFTEPKQVVYVLVSKDCRLFYVGRTGDMLRRARQHLTNSLDLSNREKLYGSLRGVGPQTFFLVPLRVSVDVISEERAVIKFLNPPLNTSHLSKKKRGRKRPVMALRRELGYEKRRFVTPAKKSSFRVFTLRSDNMGEISGLVLDSLICLFSANSVVQIEWHGTASDADLTCWRSVTRQYGDSPVLEPAHFSGPLILAVSEFRYLPVFKMTLLLCKPKSSPIKATLRKIVTEPNIWFPRLMSMRLNGLLLLLVQAKEFSFQSIGAKATESIRKILFRKYGISGLPKLVMRIPFSKRQHTGHIRTTLKNALVHSGLPPEVKDYMTNTFRIVNTRRQSIADILYNHIQFSKAFDQDSTPVCLCYKFTDHKGAHTIRLPEEFTGNEGLILSQNSRNIPHPEKVSVSAEINSAFCLVLAQISKVISQSEQNQANYKKFGSYDIHSADLASRFVNKDPSFANVFSGLAQAHERRHESVTQKPPSLSLERVYDVKSRLSGLVFLGLDKNAGKTAVLCPTKMHMILRHVFLDDSRHYVASEQDRTKIQTLSDFQEAYHLNGWRSISVLRSSCDLPYGYAIPKAKDLSRFRPIVSYFKHPLKRVFQVTQRAVMFIIKNMRVTHFTLNRTQDLLAHLAGFQTELSATFDNDTAFLPFSMDIKEMFTDLLHSVVRDSIIFVISQANDLTRSKFVRIPRDKALKCSFGKSSNRFETDHISFEQIFDVVDFDIRNAFFTVGDQIFHQINGAPIGGVLSTAEAIATCAAAEFKWLSSLGADARYLSAIRYVDDLCGIVAYRKGDQQSYSNAQALLHDLQHNCYPGGLVLKEEKIDQGQFRFLETLVTVAQDKISASFFSKNIDEICKTGSQKFYTLQSSWSYSSRKSKLGVIVARLSAINNNTNSSLDLFRAVGLFLIELRLLGYGSKIMRQACSRMQRHTGGDIWSLITRFLVSV
jgi:hypothetical protein